MDGLSWTRQLQWGGLAVLTVCAFFPTMDLTAHPHGVMRGRADWPAIRFVRRATDVPAKVDLIGVPLASLGIGAMLLGVVQAESFGVGSPLMIGAIALGIAMVGAFLVRSRRHPHPLFDLDLFSIRSYSIANAVTVLFVMAFFSWLVTMPTFIQEEWGWSVLRTGFAIAPGPLVSMVFSMRAGLVAERIGPAPLLAIGGLAGTTGIILQRLVFDATPNFVVELLLPSLLLGVAAGCQLS